MVKHGEVMVYADDEEEAQSLAEDDGGSDIDSYACVDWEIDYVEGEYSAGDDCPPDWERCDVISRRDESGQCEQRTVDEILRDMREKAEQDAEAEANKVIPGPRLPFEGS